MSKSTATPQDLERLQEAPLDTPTDLKQDATRDIAGAMNAILADVFALYLKTKNFHWHMSGPHFRDYHLLFRRTGRPALRDDGSNRRARPQGGRDHASLHRPYRPHAAGAGQ